jgi:hypothetical protein
MGYVRATPPLRKQRARIAPACCDLPKPACSATMEVSLLVDSHGASGLGPFDFAQGRLARAPVPAQPLGVRPLVSSAENVGNLERFGSSADNID